MKNLKSIIAVIALLSALVPASRADDQVPTPYPLKTCLVCGMDLGMGKPKVFVYQGQQIMVCNASEKTTFDQAPDKYMKKLADETAKLKPVPYPLNACLVCGMDLGMMGKPCVFVYRGREIKVCNKAEEKTFEQDPDKYMKKLAEAGLKK